MQIETAGQKNKVCIYSAVLSLELKWDCDDYPAKQEERVIK